MWISLLDQQYFIFCVQVNVLERHQQNTKDYRTKCEQMEWQVEELESQLRSSRREHEELVARCVEAEQQLKQFQELSAQLRKELEEKYAFSE